jgi:hypothetical protein
MAKGAPEPPGGWRCSTRPELLILDQATPAPMSKRVPSRPTWSGHHHGVGAAMNAARRRSLLLAGLQRDQALDDPRS